MTARYEAGKAEANAKLQAQQIAAADAQAAITQAAQAKLNKLQLQVCPAPLSYVHRCDAVGSPLLGCRLMFKSVCEMHQYMSDSLKWSTAGEEKQSVQRQSEGTMSTAAYLHFAFARALVLPNWSNAAEEHLHMRPVAMKVQHQLPCRAQSYLPKTLSCYRMSHLSCGADRQKD